MIHLDTSFLIVALTSGSPQDRKLRSWLRSDVHVGMSAIAWAEFLCGPLKASEVDLAGRVVTHLVPFEQEDAVVAAQFFNQSGRRRGSLADCMIAATAVRRRAKLATENQSDFERLEASDLQIA